MSIPYSLCLINLEQHEKPLANNLLAGYEFLGEKKKRNVKKAFGKKDWILCAKEIILSPSTKMYLLRKESIFFLHKRKKTNLLRLFPQKCENLFIFQPLFIIFNIKKYFIDELNILEVVDKIWLYCFYWEIKSHF